MKKLYLAGLMALVTTTSANAFTQDQAQYLKYKTIRATCVNPVTNVKMVYTGTLSSIYLSTSTGLLIVNLPNRGLTIAPHYCFIEGFK